MVEIICDVCGLRINATADRMQIAASNRFGVCDGAPAAWSGEVHGKCWETEVLPILERGRKMRR